jgi:pimeloyl-ACP methyl ester carboxylesterase
VIKRLIIMMMCLGVLGVGLVQAQETDAFQPAECPMELPDGLTDGENVICGYVTVPLYHANPDGETIRVAVAVFPAQTDTASAPLFMVQGGPGGTILNDFPTLMTDLPFGDIMLADRDVVMIEQRGTFYSEPNLICDEDEAFVRENIERELGAEEGFELGVASYRACYDRLSASYDLSAYNSVENAADLNAVREALGYDSIHLYGVSYGTLLAQHYMRAFPDTLETVILDGVVPISSSFLSYQAIHAQQVFDAFFDACANDTFCSTAYPDLENVFYNTVSNLNESPSSFLAGDHYLEPENFYNVYFNGDSLISYLFQMMYVTEFLPLIPTIITQVANGDYTILGVLSSFFDFDFSLASGMYLSVICAEDGLYDGPLDDGVNSFLYEAFVRYDFVGASCEFWDVSALDASAYEPITSDLPVLLMSGEFDPITPVSFADVVAETLPNSINLTFGGSGHGVFTTDCGTQVMSNFLNNPANPDVTCVDNMALSFGW